MTQRTPRVGDRDYRSRYGLVGGPSPRRRAGRWFWIVTSAYTAGVLVLVYAAAHGW